MAVEGSRGCGYRKVGGLYLVGGTSWTTCDRLKLEIPVCPCCGETLRPNRGIQPINLFKLVGDHPRRDTRWEGPTHIDLDAGAELPEEGRMVTDITDCVCRQTCKVCYPDNPIQSRDFIIWIGRQYYTEESFSAEAAVQGISRRIPHIPATFRVGVSVVYLAMQKNMTSELATGADGRPIKANGIFMAFRPQRLEYLIWESEATPEYVSELEERGITPVIIPDDDEDHRPTRRRQQPIQQEPETEQTTVQDFFNQL